jgi:Na+-transporting NADH:ubiquinone oxidoreductase subunit NqrF
MRFRTDLFWLEEFDDLMKKYPNFKFDLVLSKPGADWTGCRGHVNDCLVVHHQAWTGGSAYLCGNQMMIAEVAELLENLGLEKSQIYFEQFY